MHSTDFPESIFPLSFQLESLNLLVLLQYFDAPRVDPLCNEYDKLFVKVLSYLMNAN